MGIRIGNNNKIQKSIIANTINENTESHPKRWYEKHPIIGGIIVSVIAGIILMFSFWDKIVKFIEGVF